MRILHVIPSFHPARAYGGPVRTGYDLCRSLAELGHDVRVLTTNADGLDKTIDVNTETEVESAPGLRVRYCRRILRHSVSPALVKNLPAYARWADIVHLTAVYSFPTFPTLLTARIFRKPILWSARGALQRWEGTRRPVLKRAWEFMARTVAPRSTALHFTSEAEARESAERLPATKSVTIPNGVEIPAQVEHTPANGTFRLLFLGRLDPIKGIDALLRACAILNRRSDLRWSLTIAGSGAPAYAAELKGLSQQLGLELHVRFTGAVADSDKADLFSRCDILILPSHRENFGMVAAEALAHEVPVIASKGTPWQGLVRHECGMWVDDSPDALAEALVAARGAPLRDMGVKGRTWVASEMSWKRIAAEMANAYQQLVAGAAPR